MSVDAVGAGYKTTAALEFRRCALIRKISWLCFIHPYGERRHKEIMLTHVHGLKPGFLHTPKQAR